MEAKLAQYEELKAKLELQLADLIKQGKGETEEAQQLQAEIDRLSILIDSIKTTISEETNTSTDSETETETEPETESTDNPSTDSETPLEPSVTAESSTQN